jgi:oligoribonuclease NrnB/cAMP/cGMP phosphodiesterase (DHH superfamily)
VRLDPSEVDLVIYHSSCTDGFGAAFAAWLARGSKAEYVSAKYNEPPPDVTGRNVLIVDFSFRRKVLLEMASKARSILVLDHHKSAMEELQDLDFVHFDMSCSGAMLSWAFFHPDEHPPQLIRYIQDRDLWQWRLPSSREFSAGLLNVPFDFEEYRRYAQDSAVQLLINEGAGIVRYIDREVERLCKHAADRRLRVAPHLKCKVINTSNWVSEVGAKLSEDADAAVMWYLDHRTDRWRVSMRSRPGVDVAEIAKHYGGGGHEQAAGFTLGPDDHIEGIFLLD